MYNVGRMRRTEILEHCANAELSVIDVTSVAASTR
jgi:hypothetical protein